MLQRIFLIAAICGIFASSAAAEDYIIQLDFLKYSLPKNSDTPKDPPETISSVELVCTAGNCASAKATIGKHTISLKASIKSVEVGMFKLDVDCRHAEDTGSTIPDKNGVRRPSPAETVAQTQITVLKFNQPVELGSLITTNRAGRWKECFQLTLKEHRPDAE